MTKLYFRIRKNTEWILLTDSSAFYGYDKIKDVVDAPIIYFKFEKEAKK